MGWWCSCNQSWWFLWQYFHRSIHSLLKGSAHYIISVFPNKESNVYYWQKRNFYAIQGGIIKLSAREDLQYCPSFQLLIQGRHWWRLQYQVHRGRKSYLVTMNNCQSRMGRHRKELKYDGQCFAKHLGFALVDQSNEGKLVLIYCLGITMVA